MLMAANMGQCLLLHHQGDLPKTYSVVSAVPVRGSQNFMRLSLLLDTSKPMVGCHSTHLTSHPCPVRMRSSRLSAKDQTRTVESSLAVAKRSSSESAYGLAMCTPRGEVAHVRLEILDDSGLVCRSDIGAGLIEGDGTDSGIMRLKNGLKVERQTVPSCKLSARGTGQDAAALRCPLGAMLGRRET